MTTDYFTIAFNSVVWPLVGFVFMPLSTLAFTWAMNDPRGTSLVPHLVLLVLCVLTDLYIIGLWMGRRRRES